MMQANVATENTNQPVRRGRGRPVGSTNKKVEGKEKEQKEKDLSGLENHFRDVVINSGMVFVTVGDDIKKVKKELVSEFGPRKTSRINVDKQAVDLTLKRFRQMFGLQGRHLTLKFVEQHDDKLLDESGKEVIHFQPHAPAS